MDEDKTSRSTRDADDRERHERLEAVNRSLDRHNRDLIERRGQRETQPEDAAESLMRLGARLKSELEAATTLDSLVAAIRTTHEAEPSYAFLAFALYVLGREQAEWGSAGGAGHSELAEIFEQFSENGS